MRSRSTTGRILLASPKVSDGIFDRSVVFMLHHGPDGAAGVIISKPSRIEVDELLPRWKELAHDPAVVFEGGPVEPYGFIALARPVDSETDIGVRIGDGDLCSIDLEGDPTLAAAGVDRLRIFRGYSGWGAGQLDGEIRDGGWFVVDAADSDLWSQDPADLYDRVARRQRGPLAWIANMPPDPTVN